MHFASAACIGVAGKEQEKEKEEEEEDYPDYDNVLLSVRTPAPPPR